MARLIDVEDYEIRVAQKSMTEVFPNWKELPNEVRDAVCKHAQYLHVLLETQPTVDAVPVVHGRWVDHMVRDWRCSECGEPIYKVRHVDGYCYDDKPSYCPNCGAKMDGER